MMKRTVAILAAVLAAFDGGAQVPQIINYQGRLLNGTNLVNGSVGLSLRLFNLPGGGSSIYEDSNSVTVVDGLYSTFIGDNTTGGSLVAALTNEQVWIEVAVNGTALTPRERLASVAYALDAQAAGVARSVAAGAITAAMIATGAVQDVHLAAGAVGSAAIADGAVGAGELGSNAVTTAALADGAVTAAKVGTVSNWFALTLANPTPADSDEFGSSVAAVGSDRVLVGASHDNTAATDAGAAYLFGANGTLLTTFSNPTPAAGDYFGVSVAAVGSDRVLIGAPEDDTGVAIAGAAYLFGANGALLTTFTNPTPADYDDFGISVAAVGSDRVLIGAHRDDTGAANAGAAHLFRTNGALLTTFTNPTPADHDYFGWSVAAVGSDRVLIGAFQDNTGATDAGAAYLFSTNGTLLATFTNPTPAAVDYFGASVAAVGSDRVLIGAYHDDTGAMDAGAAYLFGTNGTLLTTFTNPTPVLFDYFGACVAAVGNDRVLIGAYHDDTGAMDDAGAAYLFSTGGALLTTFTNPTPADYDNFGWSVAAVGSDRVLIGAHRDNTGAEDAGAAYLFSIETFTDGLVADAVRARSITTASLEEGSVTAAKIGGVLFASQIPDLDASRVSSGVFTANRIPSLDASKITSGTLADARLSTNVALLNANQVFSGSNRFAGVVTMTNAANTLAGTFTGNGAGLTNLNAAQITGTISSNNIAAGTISGAMLASGAVGSNQLADGAVTAAKVSTASNWFALTLANPTPAVDDAFGFSVAAMGSDRVLIGAYYDDAGAVDAGAAYLFGTNGALLTTFTNPTPAASDYFGHSVAAVGSDRVLIGAYGDDTGVLQAGAAYLFSTNGTLLTTFTNPTPAASDLFGSSLTAVGSGRVLIGAYQDDTGAANAGAAYLFGTNGALLTTFTNPTPASGDVFGFSVAAVGSDRVFIGAYNDDTVASDAGAAYLFSTNGVLLTTFTNPTPAASDVFGVSVAAVGSDRVLIGARGDDTGAANAGAAYLFGTNGVLLATFTNPTPALIDFFGYSVAAVGNDRVLIGAYSDDTGAADAGAAYLFSTNGVLLATFTNPTPVAGDLLGYSVAAVGNDRVLMGAHGDDTGAPDAGAAYLFSLETFADGLVADAMRARSVTTASLEDGAVTLAKLDPTMGVWTRSGDDAFRLAGNVGIGTSSFTSNRLEVAGMVGATAFNATSDRAAKENFAPVDPAAVLEKVAALPITQWSFKDMPGARHVGPMAQDFRAAFGLGYDEKHIATVDADGVALAAIQALARQNAEFRRANDELRKELHALKTRLEAVEKR